MHFSLFGMSLGWGRGVWAGLVVGLVVGALALGGVGNAVYAADPEFVEGAGARSIAENTPAGVNIGAPISATDADEGTDEFGDTLTYSLVDRNDNDHHNFFDIDASTGQLITKAPLDAEGTTPYTVTVRVDDGENRDDSPITQEVRITVDNVANAEAPLAPFRPTVVSGVDDDNTDTVNESTTRLQVVWHAPVNMGRPVIDSYAVQYKKSTDTTFGSENVGSIDGTSTTITGLTADTSYDVRVQATNGDGAGLWSLVGTGSTNKEGNSPPKSTDESTATRRVDENTPAGKDVGNRVSASDDDSTSLTYRLEGPDAHLFSFDTRSGQIRTKAPLNHENAGCAHTAGQCTYRVTVVVSDGAGGADATAVNVLVDDLNEAASAPGRPTVRAAKESSTGLEVSWKAPSNTGPPIASYIVQYRKGSEAFSANGVDITDTTATISGTGDHDNDSNTADAPWLTPDTTYEVRVRAQNGERISEWSTSGTGRTSRANHQPIFDERPHPPATGSDRKSDYTISRVIDENARSGQSIARVFADDQDNDKLTYKLSGTDAAKFGINESTGQIRTIAGVTYNYEAITGDNTCGTLTEDDVGSDRCYEVTVEVRDGLNDHRVKVEEADADDSITVKIGVRDRDEPPSAPTVTVTSPAGNTTLIVIWEAENTGPAITGYDVQYRKGSTAYSNDNCENTTADDNCDGITNTTTTITGLDEDTSYSVQVRAKNDEGTSAWSRTVTLKTNKGDNATPTFDDNASPVALAVDENTSSNQNVGTAVSATDTVTTNLTYTLEGRDAALFSISGGKGQIKTKSKLNHEDPACGYVATDSTTSCTYKVRVKVDDKVGGSVSKEVTITVTDKDEPPSAPTGLRVTATKDTGWSLDVTWNEPSNTGKPPINDYDIEYREYKSGDDKDTWAIWPHGTDDAGNTDREATITRRLPGANADPLKPSTQYDVRVRAKNGEGDTTENWSSVVRGTTGKSNSRPAFDDSDAVVDLSVAENTGSGQNVGSAVSASDADSNTLKYSLEGPGASSFTIVSSTGQIKTKAALDYEARDSYALTVKVDDGQKRANSVDAKSVKITVDDVREQPPAPAKPTVSGIPGSTDSIRVTWTAPANTGPPIIGYDIHVREVGGGPERWTHDGTDRMTIITGRKAGTNYEVQVRARSTEGTGDWSSWGRGAPNPDVANRDPAFSGGARTLSVAENTTANSNVGAPVGATDRDGDVLTYSLEGPDATSFDILSTSEGGQIRTSAALNHEDKSSYSVTMRVTDDRGGTDAVNVTIRVTDVDGEAPETPFAPTVAAVSSTSLQVNWEEPGNDGPPVTDYDYRYREPSGTWTAVTNTTIASTTVTITGLTASTSYDVEVRAKNAEGTSEWSTVGVGTTNDPDANNTPVFSEGARAERSVSATSAAGTAVGLPLKATDSDSGDKVSYTLGGRDAAFFEIGSATGQLTIKSGARLIAGETYTVAVSASDGEDSSQITVSVEALEAPPNNVPAFTEGATATRTVKANAPVGTAIGTPLAATDADVGETLKYALGGTDAASFDINTSNGQLRTKSGVKLIDKEYSVTVTVTDPHQVGATITVTITATDTPGAVALGPSSPQEGDTVTATLTDADLGVAGVTWVWERSGNTTAWSTIAGATGGSYRATAADVGSFLRATASYTDAASGTVVRSAVGVTAAAVAVDDDGVVTLTPSSVTAGETVTATLSDPDGGVTGETWQWYTSRSGVSGWTAIAGATSSSYTAKAGDTGNYLRASVRYTDNAGSGRTAEGVTASAVAEDDDGVVTLSTTMPRVGTAIMASLSDPDGGVTGVAWGWERSGDGVGWTSIIGATSSYTPREGDVGMYLRATASYTDAVGSGKRARAETTASVAVEELIERYDTNGDGMISRAEALEALKDYFNDEVDLTDMVRIIQEYFG